jgi:hypothetical protein
METQYTDFANIRTNLNRLIDEIGNSGTLRRRAGETDESIIAKLIFAAVSRADVQVDGLPDRIIIKKTAAELASFVVPAGYFAYAIDTGDFVGGDGVTAGGNSLGGGGDGVPSVSYATQTNINLASAPVTIDGQAPSVGDKILVKHQSSAGDNGVYVYNGNGVAMTRDSSYNQPPNWFGSKLFYIAGGDVSANNIFGTTNPITFTFGDPLSFNIVSAPEAADMPYTPDTLSDYETGTATDVNSAKKALDKVAALRAQTLKEDTSANVYAEVNTRLVRNNETDELFLVIGDGATATAYRFNTFLDARTAVIPGATPNQPIHPHVSSPDGSVLELVKDSNGNWRAFYIPGDGSTKREIALGVAGEVDASEMFDIEYTDVDNVIGLGASEKYSIISGNSDSLGANGLPIVQNFQQADAGANPYPLVISGGGNVAPLGKKLNKLNYIIRNYVGAIDDFLFSAQQGEVCLAKTASSIVGVTAPVDKFYACVKTAGRIIDGTDLTTTITGSADNAGDIQFTCSGATDLTANVNVNDIIYVSGADGDSAELGQHKVKARTATTITVETNWHAGSASTTGTIRLSALVEALTSTTI